MKMIYFYVSSFSGLGSVVVRAHIRLLRRASYFWSTGCEFDFWPYTAG